MKKTLNLPLLTLEPHAGKSTDTKEHAYPERRKRCDSLQKRPLLLFALLLNFGLTEGIRSQCWQGLAETDLEDAVAFCDHVTFNYTITNNCSGAHAFNINIAFVESSYDLISIADMPGAVYTPGTPVSTITWTTPSIASTASFDFEIVLLSTTESTGPGSDVEYRAKRTTDPIYILTSSISPDIIGLTYVAGPETASQLIDDYWNTNKLTILPLDNLSTPVKEACDPTASQELFISGGIDFELGTAMDPVTYCLHNETAGSKIYMDEGSFIKVSAYTTLEVTDMLIEGCQKMWKGFYVEKGAKLVLRNCTIRDAQYAVEAERGATVECFGNTFEDNFVGVYVAPMPTEPIGDPPVYEPEPFEDAESSYVNMIRFVGNVFTGTGSMLEPYTAQDPVPGDLPFAGVWVTDLSSFRVPFAQAGGSSIGNVFENMTNGVILANAAYVVEKAQFIDIREDAGSSYSLEGFGIHSTGQLTGRVFGFGGTDASFPSFDGCDVGIYSESGSLFVKDNAMLNMDYGVITKKALFLPTQIQDNYIEATTRGIQVSHGLPLSSGHIEGNHIIVSGDQDESACIAISHFPVADRWQVNNNVLELGTGYAALWLISGEQTVVRNNSIQLQSSLIENRYGIYVEGTKDVELGCNYIVGDVGQMNSKFNRGIYLSGTPGAGLSCNFMESARFGINTSGMCDGSVFRGNEIGSNWDGVLLGRYPDDGNTVIGEQIHQGNLWTSTYGHYGAVHLAGPLSIIIQSRFFVDEAENSDYLPSVLSTEDWFFDVDDNNSTFECEEDPEQCPDGIGYQGLTPVWTELDTLLAIDNLGFEKFDTSLSWTGRFHVYRRIKAWENELVLPEVLDDFLANNVSSNIGVLSDVMDSLASAFYVLPGRGVDMSGWADDLAFHLDSIHILDTLLYDDPEDVGNLTDLSAELESVYDIAEEYKDTLKSVLARSLTKVVNAKMLLNAVSSGRSWELDLRDALKQVTYYLDGSQSPNTSLLELIAESCPDAQGDGVFIARSRMDEMGLGVGYNDYAICSIAEPRSAGKFLVPEGLLLSPNPANWQVNVESRSSMSRLLLTDLSGRILEITTPGSFQYELDVRQLMDGLYIVTALHADGTSSSAKLMIKW